jgi:hypothetical protein
MLHFVLATMLGVVIQAPDRGARREAWVSADALMVLVEPDDAAFATGRLRRGDRVIVRGEGPAGWATIDPPPGSFSWVERSAIEEVGAGRARVVVKAAAIRPGGERARLPAGVWTVLRQGDRLRLVERVRPLVLRQADGSRRVWIAVEPPEAETRYVRLDGLSDTRPGELVAGMPPRGEPSLRLPEPGLVAESRPEGDRRSSLASRQREVIDPAFGSVGPPVSRIGLASGFASALDQAEASHRAVLVLPVEAWRLDAIRGEYRAVHDRAVTPEERAIAQSRLDQLDRQMAVSKAARELAALADRGRRRDGEVAALKRQLAELAGAAESPFETRGLLHRSSRLIDGRRAYVVIDDDGRVAAYLHVPPGLDADRLVARRVGVRGEPRFDEDLRERVIWVRTIEALDEAP